MEWTFSRHVWSRSAGFSTDILEELRSDGSSRAVDRIRELDQALTATRAELLELLRAVAGTQGEHVRESRRLRRALRGTAEIPSAPAFAGVDDRARWDALSERTKRLRHELRDAERELSVACTRDLGTFRERIAARFADARVLRGAWLSSRSMAEAFRTLARPGSRGGSRRRAVERRAVLFAQRLAAKYPLLGDVGTCAWGRTDPELAEPLRYTHGPSLIAARHRCFEHWAIQAIARAIHADPLVREHCPVRLTHGCSLEGRTLYYPIGHRANLEAPQIELLSRCDGSWRLGALRAWSVREPGTLERLLDDYLARGVLTTAIPIPTGRSPEQHLLAFLHDLPDECEAKRTWLARAEAVVELRDAIARAESSDDERAAERKLDDAFVQLTGTSPTRGHGAVHGARFLTYEETRRDVEITIGRPVVRDLEQLRPVLDLCRWIALACGDAYERRYGAVFDRLAGGLDQVDCVRLMRETQWISESNDIEAELERTIQSAWADRLGERAGSEAVDVTPDDVRAVLAGLPERGAPAPWLPAADVQALGVLPARTSDDGGYQLVLGRLYKGVPVLAHPAALAWCPARDAVIDELASWLRGPLLQLADTPETHHRSNLNLPDIPGLHEALLPGAHSSFARERTVVIGELVVVREGGRLWVQTRDGRLRCGLLALRWSMLQAKLLDVTPFPRRDEPSVPRVTMGNWVLSRARWRASTAALLRDVRTRGALGAARSWQHELGLPDRVFVRTDARAKAIYVDLRSLPFADLLVALARECDDLEVVEMLPTPEQCWMRDRDGRGFVSDLRITALMMGGQSR